MLIAGLAYAWVVAVSGPAAGGAEGTLITGFDGGPGEPAWIVVNDDVMGGRSTGGGVIEGGVLTFSGSTNTDGGGFASLRTRPGAWDLRGYDGLLLRVRGDGRPYRAELRTDETFRGISVAYRAEFETSDDGAWREHFVPFADFEASVFGRDVSGSVERLDPGDVRSVGLMIYDGRDGPFEIEVDWIRAAESGGDETL